MILIAGKLKRLPSAPCYPPRMPPCGDVLQRLRSKAPAAKKDDRSAAAADAAAEALPSFLLCGSIPTLSVELTYPPVPDQCPRLPTRGVPCSPSLVRILGGTVSSEGWIQGRMDPFLTSGGGDCGAGTKQFGPQDSLFCSYGYIEGPLSPILSVVSCSMGSLRKGWMSLYGDATCTHPRIK